MKTINTILLVLILASINYKVQATADSQNLPKSLVWEISGPDLQEPSYLAGTLHMMCEKDFFLDQRYQTAIDNSSQLYLELDFDDTSSHTQLQQAMFVNQPLSERLSEAQYQQLKNFLELNSNLSLEMLDKMDFFAIQATLLVSQLACPIKSVDQELMILAKSSGQEVFGLETAEEQIQFIQVFTPKKADHPWTEEEFAIYIDSASSFPELLKAYSEQDIDQLYRLVADESLKLPEGQNIIDTVLNQRNIKWVAKMPDIMKQQPTFFAVGSGHLAGEFGVINLLRKSGFTVKPVLK